MSDTFFKITYEERHGERECDREAVISARSQEQAIYDFLPTDVGFSGIAGPENVSLTVMDDGMVRFDEKKSPALSLEDEFSVWDGHDMILQSIYISGPFAKTKCELCGSEVLKPV